ncbi:MAG: non-canonical purine NTP pyrophosphatase, RdgB/HAM1 family [Micavibrio aeruginosavorus]|uniref:dITP/XTP pyrophosphatase n=1 Tax=Micavibrio aeruginosavorus TaxID=349221 RepID=A0A2W5HFH6_9BACT|nr:MAG: non-canonical purine NTP pyrophosphatase, RdgB/HAM1 family [Micavibrio aeruginosavorus]
MKFEGKKLVLATHNKGKIEEIKNLLAPYDIEILSAADMHLPEPDETENTFIGNATLKAKAAAVVTGLPCLSDDSGLSVNALNGEPGVYSADWAEEHKGGPRDFQKAMALVNEKMGDAADRSAYFTSVLVIANPDGSVMTAEGRIGGEIVWPPRGAGGFGYDPIFMPEGEERTFGEMKLEEKKNYSHRARAFKQLLEKYFV